jgi:copper chaperone CopZ
MDTVNFKTNIKCSGCVAQVTPELNKAVGESNWQVDTASPDKTLSVSANDVSVDKIVEAVKKAGFKAELEH